MNILQSLLQSLLNNEQYRYEIDMLIIDNDCNKRTGIKRRL